MGIAEREGEGGCGRRGVRATAVAEAGVQTSDVAKRRIARAGRSVGPASGAPAWGVFVTGVGCQLLREGPAADGSAIELERMTAMDFRSGEAVGGWRDGTEQLAQQSEHRRRPLRETVATGTPRLPVALRALGAGAQIGSVDLVEAAATEAQFRGCFACWQSLSSEPCQDITNEGSGVAAAQLLVVFSSGKGRGWGRERVFTEPPLCSGSAKNAVSWFDRTVSCFACPVSCFARTTTGQGQARPPRPGCAPQGAAPDRAEAPESW